MRVFCCPFLSPSLLHWGLFVRGFVSSRNLVESFGHGLLRDSEIHCLWLWGTCLSSLLPSPSGPHPLWERRPSLNSPSIHRLHEMPPWVWLRLGFWGKHGMSWGFTQSPMAPPAQGGRTRAARLSGRVYLCWMLPQLHAPGTVGAPDSVGRDEAAPGPGQHRVPSRDGAARRNPGTQTHPFHVQVRLPPARSEGQALGQQNPARPTGTEPRSRIWA